MQVLLGVAIALLLVTTAFAAAVFAGVINVGQRGAPAEIPFAAPSQTAAQTQPGASASTAASAPTAAAARQPNVVQQQTFGDWIYACVESPQQDQVRCSITQHLSEAQTREMIFLWRIVQDGKGGLTGIWQTPDAVLLQPGVTVEAGGPEPLTIPYETCRRGRCQATATLSGHFVGMLAQADSARATIVARGGQAVNLTLSVVGLADALAALRNPNPPAN